MRLLGSGFGVVLEYKLNVINYLAICDAEITGISPIDGKVNSLPFTDEIVINYTTRRDDEALRVFLDDINITNEAAEHTKDQMKFRASSSPAISNLTPAIHTLKAEIVKNNTVVASKTSSFTTKHEDPFDNLNPRNWKEQNGMWSVNGSTITGQPERDSATASLLSISEFNNDVRMELWATIDKESVGGVSILFNSNYEVIFGDGDNNTVKLKRGLETLMTARTPLLKSGQPHVFVVERVNGKILVLLDQREIISYLDYQEPPGSFSKVGLRVWKSKVHFDHIAIWSPKPVY